jgi:spore maturation protein CgeB
MVQTFRGAGIAAEWVPLAFEPRVIQLIGPRDRDVPISFVGSFTDAYADRTDVVEAVALVADLQTWTDDRDYLPTDSAIIETIRGSAFGREMYEVLARSRVTLNSHGRVSGHDANNLRLFEATGMGSLLVTDHRKNLGDMFDIGTELVTYRTPREAGDLVNHYLANPDEAARIAHAGQARTLREHTWENRMSRFVEAVRRLA